jgi:hypothetical protein
MESVAHAVAAAGGPPAPLGGGPAVQVSPAAPAPQSYFLAAAIGIAVAFAIGAGAFLVWHVTRSTEAAVPSVNPAVSVIIVPAAPPAISGAFPPSARAPLEGPSAAAPVPSASVAAAEPSPAPPPTGGAAAPPPPAVEPPAPAAPPTGDVPAPAEPVVLNVPDGASILVGGVALEDGARTVGRPKPGKTVAVVVRAAGYDDAVLVIDATTASPLEVTLHKHRHRAAPVIPANPY